jgi:acetyltransferase
LKSLSQETDAVSVNQFEKQMNFQHYLASLLNPSSIALIGASSRAGSIGTLLWNHLSANHGSAVIYPVNPKYKNIQDAACFSSVKAVPAAVDVAVLAAPPAHYIRLIGECAEKQVKAVVLCGGYPKSQLPAGLDKAVEEAKQKGIRFLGPQSLGIINTQKGINLSFRETLPAKGGVGLVSQSPGLSTTVIDFASTITGGFSYVIDPGQEWDLDVADFVDFLAWDRSTQCIVLYLESFKRPRLLLSAVQRARRSKPVLVLRGGRTPFAADLITSHTGSLPDEDGFMETAFRRSGAILLDSLLELQSALQVLTFRQRNAVEKVCGIVNSKGVDTLLADLAFSEHLNLSRPTAAEAKMLSETFGISNPYSNPLTTGLTLEPKKIAQLTDAVSKFASCDAVLLVIASNPVQNSAAVAKALLPVLKKSPKTIIPIWIGGSESAEAQNLLNKNGFLSFCSMEAGTKALSFIRAIHKGLPAPEFQQTQIPRLMPDELDGARKIIRKAQLEGRNLLYETETKRLLASLGFETTACLHAGSPGEVREARRALGFPLAMKIRTDGILSKSEFGGVVTGIRSDHELLEAWNSMKKRIVALGINPERFAVTLQKSLPNLDGREFRLGFRTTKNFGPVVYFGIGGFYGDAAGSCASDFAPLDYRSAKALIEKPSFKVLLDPYKGLGACDRELLIRLLLKVSRAAENLPALRSLNIDPLLLGEDAAVVLDAHASVGSGPVETDEKFSHLIFPKALSGRPQLIENPNGPFYLKTAEAGDFCSFRTYLSALSERSRQLRFHSIGASPDAEAAEFLLYDPDRSYSVFVTASDAPGASVIAEATFSELPDAAGAEFGISVSDKFQRKGLAKLLMEKLEEEAKKRGLQYLLGYVLKENSPMLAFMKSRGYACLKDSDDPKVFNCVLRFRG